MQKEVLKTKRTDIMLVDPRNIVVEKGFNVRQDMGNLQELSDSIVELGQQVPLKAYKERGTDNYVLVDGHRRLSAIRMVIEQGHDIPYVEVTTFKGSEEDRIFSMIVTGTGQKPLTDLEQAEGVKRLVALHYSVEEIAKKIGKSVPYIYNLLKLADVPKEVKNLINSGDISGNTVVLISKEAKSNDEITKVVRDSITNAKEEAIRKNKKHIVATAKNVSSLKNKNPFSKLEEVAGLLRLENSESENAKFLSVLIVKLKNDSVDELFEYYKTK